MKSLVRNKKKRFTPLAIVLFAILAVYTLSFLGLMIWGVLVSFMDSSYYLVNPKLDFSQFTIKNYTQVISVGFSRITSTGLKLGKANLVGLYTYSILYAVGCAFTSTIVPTLTAYFCAKYNYKYSKIVYSVVVIVMAVPIVGSLPSEIRVAKALGLFDHIYGLWIMRANTLGIYFLLLYEFYKALPDAYIEAAKIDGASDIQILFKIALPLVRNLFFTIFLINFVTFWNEYQIPFIYMKPYPTIAYALFSYSSGGPLFNERGWGSIPASFALATYMFVPTLIIFIFTHKRMMGNLSVGGIK